MKPAKMKNEKRNRFDDDERHTIQLERRAKGKRAKILKRLRQNAKEHKVTEY